MKRHFLTGLKALAVSALAFAAVSCYDDSELWGELEGLEQRVAALEEKLNTEVSTLNSKLGAVETAYKAADADLLKKLTDLDAKLVAEVAKLAADLDAADGNFDGLVSAADLKAEIEKLAKDIEAKYTELKGVDTEILAALVKGSVSKIEKTKDGAILTFTDGSTLEVSSSDKTNNEGLVTVVDGKWAIVGADGKTTVLDALVHPDTELEFKVDPKTYEVFVTYNGEDWVATGVVVKDTETINIVTGFKEAKDYVVITVGGVDYKLPKVSTNSFDIRSGKVFFQSEQRKVVAIKQDGVVSSMLAKKPAGWEVELVDESLVITAPLIEEGGAGVLPMPMPFSEEGEIDTEGVIEVWAVTEDGKTIVGKLLVEVGDSPATIVVDGDYETVSVAFDNYYQDVMFWGACAVEEFDAKALIAKMEEAVYSPVSGIYYGYDHASWNNETGMMEAEHNFADMLGAEPEVGKTYIIWSIAADMDMDFMTQTATCNSTEVDFIKQYVTVVGVEIAKPETTWNDANLSVKVEGTDKFYIGLYPNSVSLLTDPNGGTLSQEGIQSIESMNKTNLFDVFENYYVEGIQIGAVVRGSYEGLASMIAADSEMEVVFNPGETYTLIVLPYLEGKTEYSASNLHFKEFTLDELNYGGQGTIQMEADEVSFTDFSFVAEFDTKRLYYSVWPKAAYDAKVKELEDDNNDDTDMLGYFMDNLHECEVASYGYAYAEVANDYTGASIQMSSEYVVAMFGVDTEGNCTEISTLPIKTLGISYTETPEQFNVSVTSAKAVGGVISAEFAITGENAASLHYNICLASTFDEGDEDSIKEDLIKAALVGDWYNGDIIELNETNLVDGKVTLPNAATWGNNNEIVVVAYIKDSEGNISYLGVSDVFANIPTPTQEWMNQWIIMPEDNTGTQEAPGWKEFIAPIRGLIDLGYTESGKFILAMSIQDQAQGDPEYEDMWQQYNSLYIENVIPTDNASGTITLYSFNMFEEKQTTTISYSNLSESTCDFDLTNILAPGYGFKLEVTCVLSDFWAEFMPSGGGLM